MKKRRYEYEFAFLTDNSQRQDLMFFDFDRIGLKEAIETYEETGRGDVLIYVYDWKLNTKKYVEVGDLLAHKYANKIAQTFIKRTAYNK